MSLLEAQRAVCKQQPRAMTVRSKGDSVYVVIVLGMGRTLEGAWGDAASRLPQEQTPPKKRLGFNGGSTN